MNKTVKSRYSSLKASREPYVSRARDAALLTLPTVLPYEGSNSSLEFPVGHQSVGARGVNHLSAKLLLTLLPPNSPFFRLIIDEQKLSELDGSPEIKAQVLSIIASIEKRILREIDLRALRVPVHDALKQLIITGNCMLYMPKKGGIRVYPITQYVVSRDSSDNITEIHTEEVTSKESLPTELQSLVKEDEKEVSIYTSIIRETDDSFSICQYIDETEIQGSKVIINSDDLPYFPLRWSIISGEDYGRGLVEEYMGDLMNLEGLSKAVLEGSAIAARVIGLINPAGNTEPSDLNNADNGKFVMGLAQDVSFLQLGKFGDFQVAQQSIAAITKRIEAAFLLTESITRNAERVTAEEIRLMANELESTLGGVYAVLSQTMQQPLVKFLMKQLQESKAIPRFPEGLKNSIQPTIITGVSALGRSSDIEKLRTFIALGTQMVGPNELVKRINPSLLLQSLATSVGLDITEIFKSEQEIQQAEQAANNQAIQRLLLEKGTAPGITAISNNLPAVQNAIAAQQG